MAEILVQNMRNPSQLVNVMVNLKRSLIATEELPQGNLAWILEVATKTKAADGQLIPPVKKHISSRNTFTDDVNDAIAELCRLITWDSPPDELPPEVATHWPFEDADSIPVTATIICNITDAIPSSGIDIDSIKIKVKGFDLTDQLTINGNLRDYILQITPGTKYKSAIPD